MGAGTVKVSVFGTNVIVNLGIEQSGQTEKVAVCFFSGEQLDRNLVVIGINVEDDITLTGSRCTNAMDQSVSDAGLKSQIRFAGHRSGFERQRLTNVMPPYLKSHDTRSAEKQRRVTKEFLLARWSNAIIN